MSSRNILTWFGVLIIFAILFLCVLLYVLGNIWFYNLDAPSEENGRQEARPLINAIQTYRQKTGDFPESLQNLVPEYFPTVPKPDWRHEYEYNANEKAFSIAFVPKNEAIGDGWYVYCSSSNKWQGTDSGGWEYVFYNCSK